MTVTIIIVLLVAAVLVISFIPTFLMIAGNRRYDNGDIDGAFEKFEKAYATGRLRPTFVIYYAYLILRHKSPERAYTMLTKLINKKKCDAQTLLRAKHNIALALWRTGRLDEAISLLEKVHTQGPTTITTGALGALYLERAKRDNDFDSALRFALEAYEYNDEDITIADNLGEIYFLLGETEKARALYEALFALGSPKTPTPYFNCARTLYAAGDKDGAREMAQTALNMQFTNLTTVEKNEIETFADAL
ncbi:MAG: tetratricopeptide repeat protein [Clostridia bacterium]|nr:tetratricopeptide repeat protein [Clostridia bacterium]